MVAESKVVSTEPVVIRPQGRHALPVRPQPWELATFLVGVAGVVPTSLLTMRIVIYATQGSGLWWGALGAVLTAYFGTMAVLWAVSANTTER